MTRFILPLAILAALSGPAAAAETASLTVTVTGISAKGGTLMVSAIDQQSFAPGSKPLAARQLPATAGEMTVRFDAIPAGEIGVRVLQDLNGNGKMDYAMGVFPSEPYGFSNNPVIKMGPPSWDEIKLQLKPGTNAITVKMN